MSGSYDRPTGRPQQVPPRPRGYDPYDDLEGGYVTGPAPAPAMPHDRYEHEPPPLSADTTMRPTQETPVRRSEIYAPARAAKRKPRTESTAPIVPAGSVTGQSLTLVITIMCFLACLTAGAVYMIRQSADAWLKDIASEVTVQIEPKEKVDTDTLVKEGVAFLGRQPGIRSVRPLTPADSAELLEPWLGGGGALKALPVPRLIALELDP